VKITQGKNRQKVNGEKKDPHRGVLRKWWTGKNWEKRRGGKIRLERAKLDGISSGAVPGKSRKGKGGRQDDCKGRMIPRKEGASWVSC